jgi:hypothetical protein
MTARARCVWFEYGEASPRAPMTAKNLNQVSAPPGFAAGA